MAGALEEFFSQGRRTGVELTPEQKRALNKQIQTKGKGGKGKTITGKELARGQKAATANQFDDFLGTVARNYGVSQLGGKAKRQLEQQGYTQEGGYYTRRGPITGSLVEKAQEKGFGAGDIASYIAQNFAQKDVSSEAAKFLGEGGYRLDPNSGRWSKADLASGINPSGVTTPITAGDLASGISNITASLGQTISGIAGNVFGPGSGGSTAAEIQYATLVDPEKIRARSEERQTRMSQASDFLRSRAAQDTAMLTSKIGAASALDQARLAAASDLNRARIDRLTNLQGAKIQQANYLYNLIPSAF